MIKAESSIKDKNPTENGTTALAKSGELKSAKDEETLSRWRIKILYTSEDEQRYAEHVPLVTFEPSQFKLCEAASKHNFDDLPAHFMYLKNTLLINKFPFRSHGRTEIIIVEKYKNLAIGYSYVTAKRPVILFRETWEYFKSVELGDILLVELGKMYVHVEEPTLIFTDLYAFIGKQREVREVHQYETRISRGLLKIINFTVEVSNIQQVNKHHVLFADFGAIIIPPKVYKSLQKCFVAKEHPNLFIIGEITYSLIGFAQQRYACWELAENFTVYRDGMLFAKSTHGVLQMVQKKEKRKRVTISTGRRIVRMAEPIVSKEVKTLQINFKCDFLNLSNFIAVSSIKRVVVRRN
uniref:Uncharacterized protein n=1 Tax=Panagrolaimus sp. PS1159 TaxID=55785 RepID=A0AC35GGQ3_9BILA